MRIIEDKYRSSLYDDIFLTEAELEAFDEYEKKTLREEGVEEGIEKGVKQGIEQGKNQRDKEIVINMHENGVSVSDIVRYSKLSQEKVENIISSIN